jgi:competence protein ComEC
MQIKSVIFCVLAFLIGVGWRTVSDVPLIVVIWFLVLAVGLMVMWHRKNVSKKVNLSSLGEDIFSAPYPLFASLFFLFLSLGIVRTEISAWHFDRSLLENSLGESVTLIGTIKNEPDYRERSVHLYVETEEDCVLVTTDRLQSFSYGDQVEVIGKLERPESFTTEFGRTFNYSGYLRAKGVEYIISFAKVKVTDSGFGNPIVSVLLDVKESFIKSLKLVIPEPQVGLANGLLLGVKSALGVDLEEDFRRTGIVHIVVLSGYNVMLVVAFIMFCLSFLLPFRLRIGVSILTIIAFALIVGLSATVVRASVMVVIFLISQVLGRRYDVFRSLLLAGTIMVLINPYLLIYDIGFQLSFMATLGLILIVPELESLSITKDKFGLREYLLSTVSTQIAVLPLLMYHIGQVSLISVPVNILVLPIVPVTMLLTFITGLLGPVSITIANLVGYVATLSLSYILLVVKWFSELPFSVVTVPQFSVVGVFILYTLMLGLWFFLKIRRQNSNQLVGWVIETETAGESVNDATEDSPAVSQKIPIFFR